MNFPKSKLTFGQQIFIALGFLSGVLLFVWPPSFLPKWLGASLGPIIALDIYYYGYYKAYSKEIELEKVDPNSMVNSKSFKILIIVAQIIFLITSLLLSYIDSLLNFY